MMGGGKSKQSHLPNVMNEDVAEKNTSAKPIKNTVEPSALDNKIKEFNAVPARCTGEIWECTADEDVFYKFVILHSMSDEAEAIRMKQKLEKQFHIEPGIIFAEMPCGKHKLQNLEDAVNGSAWTIILLTENFLREVWCEYQSYATLINSINKEHKYNSVIPVRPANNGLPRERTPFALQAINALEERSPAFAQQVQKIFQHTLYERQKGLWKIERWKETQQQ